MPLNLIKRYNDLLDFMGMDERARTASLRGIFNRDIQENPTFTFNGKPIYPTPKEDGMIAMENLFNHLTRKEVDKEVKHREFDKSRSERLHWIRFHTEQRKSDNMLYFSVDEPRCPRTYIYDIDEMYVIVLEPLRKRDAYYLLTAYHLEGKDAARNKIMRKYKLRKLDGML
jgi:hypothetical protein